MDKAMAPLATVKAPTPCLILVHSPSLCFILPTTIVSESSEAFLLVTCFIFSHQNGRPVHAIPGSNCPSFVPISSTTEYHGAIDSVPPPSLVQRFAGRKDQLHPDLRVSIHSAPRSSQLPDPPYGALTTQQ